MILCLYVPVSMFVILWLVSRLSEASYQLDQAVYERDSIARSLVMRFSATDGYMIDERAQR